jgi:cobalt/nickel transport system permease protein
MLANLLIHTDNANSGYLVSVDPRAKTILMIVLIGLILSLEIQNIPEVSLTLLFICILIIFSGKTVTRYTRMLVKLLPMIILVCIVLPFRSFTVPDHIVWKIFGLPIFNSGLLRFMELITKFIFIISGSMVFLATTTIQEFMRSLESLHLPVWLGAIFYYLSYFIFLLKEELFRQYLAYKTRYIRLSILKKLLVISRMTAVYFIRIIERNERVTLAMISRGFTGKVYNHKTLNWTRNDSLFLLVSVFFIVLIKVFT